MIQDVMEDKDTGTRGRPTKYDPKYCQQIIDYMSDGSSLTAFAADINVVKSTVYEWIKNVPEFKEASDIARQKCQAWWEKQGQVGLFMGKEDGSFSQSTWIFNMKARFGYRDKVEVEQKVDQTIKLAYSLDEEPEE